jgi:hypothetical protein
MRRLRVADGQTSSGSGQNGRIALRLEHVERIEHLDVDVHALDVHRPVAQAVGKLGVQTIEQPLVCDLFLGGQCLARTVRLDGLDAEGALDQLGPVGLRDIGRSALEKQVPVSGRPECTLPQQPGQRLGRSASCLARTHLSIVPGETCLFAAVLCLLTRWLKLVLADRLRTFYGGKGLNSLPGVPGDGYPLPGRS